MISRILSRVRARAPRDGGKEIASWGIYETTRRKAEAVIKARLDAAEAGRPKSEFAPGSMEYQALHPEWKPQED